MFKDKKIIILIVIGILIVGYVIWAIAKPAPKLSASTDVIAPPEVTASKVVWPAKGQAAIGAKDYGVVATNGEQVSAPIASIAKTMLAISVLQQKPLKAGEQGPSITFTQADIDKYNEYLAQNQSVVPIALNESLTEYQALQALMLPSGNNIAEALASWAFGSMEKYLAYANNQAKTWGLTKTNFADASGFSPKTVSSAQDLVVLGNYALQEPVLAEIVGQSEVTLPVAGTVYNVNTLLGQNNIMGIKTGNTDEAGGCFLFSAKNTVDGKEITQIAAILGDTDLQTVLADALKFVQTNTQCLAVETAVTKGQVVGNINVPWSGKTNLIAKDNVGILVTNGQKIEIISQINDINAPLTQGAEVGMITVKSGESVKTTPIVIESQISTPSIFWKLLHP